MATIYVGTCPYDPELELKNFQLKQLEYHAAWCLTSDPQVLREALLHTQAALRLPAELDWLVETAGTVIRRSRTDQTTERYADRMRHVQRYRCVRDYLRRGARKKQALDLAVMTLEAAGEAASWWTIKDSYNLVSRDLKRKGRVSEFFLLVARADPTAVPVLVAHGPDEVVTHIMLCFHERFRERNLWNI